MQQDDLDKKATRVFAGKVVRKDLLHQIKGGENVPSYVLEYLLGKYCASDNDEAERVFRFGSHVEGRDATAAKKTVSGLLKILHPGGGWTKEELTEYVEVGLEGRRRVKEQLKKRGSFEFYKTSFSYIDLADDTERSVGVPEQGGAGVISQDP